MAADLQSAYQLPSALLGSRQTIAIVDAYDDPNAASDLAAYRAANHLPTCDATFPCFEKVNQEGQQGSYPAPDAGWAVEESLDVDMASAICPNCKIILVEGNDNTIPSLGAAENEAAALGANVISNSYGAAEYDGELSDLGSDYDHPGIAITASSGDTGFGAQVPAALSTVIAVGGTSLYRDDSSRGWAETAWQYAGSGCSINVPKPAWQHDPLCSHRTVADVSAVADPATPVAIYDSYGTPGWVAVGGTSVASPLIAGVYALAGNTGSITPGAYLYAHQGDLSDVTYHADLSNPAPQSNGDCGGSYLCTAATGYDGPTGLGTPHGIGAF
jgi:subtilase family serine protease